MNQEKAIQLLNNYQQGKCSKQELALLHRWYEEQGKILESTPELENPLLEEVILWQRIEQELDKSVVHPANTTNVRSLKRIPYVAATLAFLISISVFLFYTSDLIETEHQLTSQYGDEVLPGGNKAYITFSDGQKMTLDSSQSGLINLAGSYSYVDGTNLVSSPAEYATVETPEGGFYQIVLSDGTKVWLNALSSIRYPNTFEGKDRQVEISGEAYLEVAPNKDQPFVVLSEGQRITVLGTAFNIRNYGDITWTTLVHGKIALSPSDTKNMVFLNPGEQARLGDEIRISKVSTIDYTLWKDGIIMKRDASLREICEELERWYAVRFVFDSEYQNEERAYNSIDRKEMLSSVLTALRNTYKVNFEIDGKEVHVK